MRRAAEEGLGAIVLGKVKHRFSKRSALVPLELDLGPHRRSQLHVVCAKSALDIPRVRVVAQWLSDELMHREVRLVSPRGGRAAAR